MRIFLFLFLMFWSVFTMAQQNLRIALLKYGGGGDWYANPTSLPNLITFCNQELNTNLHKEPATVEVGSPELFNYPLVHMTGHGNILFSAAEVQNLRKYLLGGGFMHVDDNYGLDPAMRREMKKVFPELDFVELPSTHPIYREPFVFATGLPKIHEHDGKPAQGFGLFYEGRLICFYTFECDLGDGWENPEVHKDGPDVRLKALKMGANIVQFAFSN